MAAASSSASSAAATADSHTGAAEGASGDEAGCIQVHFDDGPEEGLLAQVCEDDFCDPQYWHFKEVHADSSPAAKILFSGGLTMFLTEWPRACKGTLLDEDGDEHKYVRMSSEEGSARASKRQRLDATSCAAAAASNAAPVDIPGLAPDAEAPTVACGASPPRVAAAPAATFPATSSSAAIGTVQPSLQQPVGSDDAGVSAREREQKELHGAAVQLQQSLPPPATVGESGAASLEQPQEAPSVLFLERAKTARSSCKTCGQQIHKDTTRFGMKAYSGGRTVTVWAHTRCFLQKVNTDYATARRGKCRGSGEAFAPGDVRVSFDIGGHKTWWLPGEASRWTSQAVAAEAKESMGGELQLLQGAVGALDQEHQVALLELLQRGNSAESAGARLRKVVIAKAAARGRGRRGAAKQGGQAAEASSSNEAASQSHGPHKPGAAAAGTTEAEPDQDSDVEIAYAVEARRPTAAEATPLHTAAASIASSTGTTVAASAERRPLVLDEGSDEADDDDDIQMVPPLA